MVSLLLVVFVLCLDVDGCILWDVVVVCVSVLLVFVGWCVFYIGVELVEYF